MAIPLVGDEHKNNGPPSYLLSCTQSYHCRAHCVLYASSTTFHCSLNNNLSVTATLKHYKRDHLENMLGEGARFQLPSPPAQLRLCSDSVAFSEQMSPSSPHRSAPRPSLALEAPGARCRGTHHTAWQSNFALPPFRLHCEPLKGRHRACAPPRPPEPAWAWPQGVSGNIS